MSEAMKKTHNVVAVTGKYTDNTGQEKNRYVIVGAAFTREDGSMAIKMETIPVGTGWNGWLNLYLPKEKQQATAQPAQPAPAVQQTGGNDEPFNDPIPFGD